MANIVTHFQMVLFNGLRAKVPIDTGNMLAHIEYQTITENESMVKVSAPMSQRAGMTSRRTGAKISESVANSNYDYARAVNYGGKSPHRFWIEKRIKETAHIIRSNANHGFYK